MANCFPHYPSRALWAAVRSWMHFYSVSLEVSQDRLSLCQDVSVAWVVKPLGAGVTTTGLDPTPQPIRCGVGGGDKFLTNPSRKIWSIDMLAVSVHLFIPREQFLGHSVGVFSDTDSDTLTTSLWHCTRGGSHAISQEKENHKDKGESSIVIIHII